MWLLTQIPITYTSTFEVEHFQESKFFKVGHFPESKFHVFRGRTFSIFKGSNIFKSRTKDGSPLICALLQMGGESLGTFEEEVGRYVCTSRKIWSWCLTLWKNQFITKSKSRIPYLHLVFSSRKNVSSCIAKVANLESKVNLYLKCTN